MRKFLVFTLTFILLFCLMIVPSFAYNYGFNDLNSNYQASSRIGIRSLSFVTDEWVYTCSIDNQLLCNFITYDTAEVIYIPFYTNNGDTITIPLRFDVNRNIYGDTGEIVNPYIYFNFDLSSLLDDENVIAQITLEPFISTDIEPVSTNDVPRFIIFSDNQIVSPSSFDVTSYFLKLAYDENNETYYASQGIAYTQAGTQVNLCFDVFQDYDDNIGSENEYFIESTSISVNLPSSLPSFQLEVPLNLIQGGGGFQSQKYWSHSDLTQFYDIANRLPRPDDVVVVEKLPDTILEFFDGFTALFDVGIFGSVTLGAICIIPLAVIVVLSIMRKFAGG